MRSEHWDSSLKFILSIERTLSPDYVFSAKMLITETDELTL